ncbi:cytochrome b6-f complex iron-sulfur subunit [Pseudarcicella hirudinis]|uniref:Cytochrome b6-f complex iron-sulfur subunit n=1 Tax=Pseudarcicella hirudinis TaxID=1079859 RepID=A0A1I5WM46_9BACT|nr:Rieske 2Fe-2S domain-containing protein [Pseudarcicella hirudinis]SFQ20882.1 cytochrome b6-f complex iron-sulfur subunit [Pseudarcicella hirudinis]
MSVQNQTEKIDRLQFLKKLGLSGASLMAVYCGVTMTSCKNEAAVTPSGDFTYDLSSTANAALKTKGGYIVDRNNNLVIAYTSDSKYVAVTLVCSHEQRLEITYATNRFYCTAHGAQYDNNGKGLNAEGRNNLTTYPITQNGNILTVKVS